MKASAPIFVVQQHRASTLHWDFRLEVDGALASWAVPKGPSPDPKVKRLAIRVEDHPLDYAGFEGTIPEGEYGAGAVIVWDRGTYENLSRRDGRPEAMSRALAGGKAVVDLRGEKLRGVYALVRTGSGDSGCRWLLIKENDADASTRDPVRELPRSVLSGLTVEELARRKRGESRN
ncbi:MAG TPA: DNA polymerase ligase N-terminal domain-containing protein [bacterium]|nr:DNA polymerase ligase N-terminal domain-containing protein [bacterium]